MSDNTNIKIGWQRIIKTSHDLLDMAESSRWEEMPETATQRDKLIRNFFHDNPANSSNAEQLQKFLQEILGIDKKIMSLTTDTQSDLNGEMNKFRKATNAVHAYNNCP